MNRKELEERFDAEEAMEKDINSDDICGTVANYYFALLEGWSDIKPVGKDGDSQESFIPIYEAVKECLFNDWTAWKASKELAATKSE